MLKKYYQKKVKYKSFTEKLKYQGGNKFPLNYKLEIRNEYILNKGN